MSINDLSALVTVLLSISLAAERLVTIIKTLVPWLAEEQKNSAQEPDPVADRWRRFAVQVIAFLSAWITSAFLADGGFNLLGSLTFRSIAGVPSIPIFVLGILASGGSALWNNVLGYTKAVKDTRTQLSVKVSLENLHRAKEMGLVHEPH